MTVCEFINVLLSIFLITLVVSKWWTPMSKKQDKKSQANLIAVLLSASADFFDLIEYVNVHEITDIIGVELILSK